MHGIFAHSTSWVQFLCKYSAALGDTGGVHISAEFSSLAIGVLYTKKGGRGTTGNFLPWERRIQAFKTAAVLYLQQQQRMSSLIRAHGRNANVGCGGASRAPAAQPCWTSCSAATMGAPLAHAAITTTAGWATNMLLRFTQIHFCCKFMMHYFCERLSFWRQAYF